MRIQKMFTLRRVSKNSSSISTTTTSKGGRFCCSFAKFFALFCCIAISAIIIFSHLSLHSSCSFVLSTKRLVIFTHNHHQETNYHPYNTVYSPPTATVNTTTITNDFNIESSISSDADIQDQSIPTLLEPNSEIHTNTNQSLDFNQRVNNFLSQSCTVNFFMTWIADASKFTHKELLGIDTLFKSHPHACLLILSKSMDTPRGHKILKPFTDLNLQILPISPHFPTLLHNTLALPWYQKVKKGQIHTGKISLPQHLSDLLRLILLYKYGGVYLDTDFIILNDFSSLRNAIGAQSMNRRTGKWTRLNGAVMIYDRGHPLLLKFIEEFVTNFDGNKWGHNGPYLVSRVIQILEDGGITGYDDDNDFYNYTVLPPSAFYPVDWIKINGLFQKPKDKAHERWIEVKTAQLNATCYGIHLWNKLSSDLIIEEGSVLWRLVSKHCLVCNLIP